MRLMPPASYNPAAVREASQWILTMNIDKPLLATNQNMPTHSIHHIIKLMKDSLRAPNMINRIKADKQHSYNSDFFQFTLSEASKRIHWSLGGRGMLGSVTIQVPETWSSSDCGHHLDSSHYIGVSVCVLYVVSLLVTQY